VVSTVYAIYGYCGFKFFCAIKRFKNNLNFKLKKKNQFKFSDLKFQGPNKRWGRKVLLLNTQSPGILESNELIRIKCLFYY
jgi:hypothetical protein